MMGVFVQVNTESRHAKSQPVGYVIQENGCWDWTGGKSTDGYGRLRVGRDTRNAHRVLWEREYGPLSANLKLDHLCRNRACVNPSHVEPVTDQVNILRGDGTAAANAKKTHCPKGHVLAGENLVAATARIGRRRCRECDIARYRQRRSAAAHPEEAK